MRFGLLKNLSRYTVNNLMELYNYLTPLSREFYTVSFTNDYLCRKLSLHHH